MAVFYFGIVIAHGVERPQVYRDEVPRPLLVKGTPLVYCCRISEDLARLPVRDLYAVYRGWKADGRLPPDERGARPREAPSAA